MKSWAAKAKVVNELVHAVNIQTEDTQTAKNQTNPDM